MFFWVPIPTYTNWKKIRPDSGRGIPTIQAPMEGGEPTPPEEGSSNGAGVRQTQWKQSDLDPSSTTFLWWKSLENPTAGT